MADSDYVFRDANTQREWQRLRRIEEVFDAASQRRLLAAGVRTGARCLEIGPGAGSIARWMAGQAGPSGHVTVVEINPQFLAGQTGFEVVQGDIREVSLPAQNYDVIHGRYVLLHIPDYRKALANMLCALKPGGYAVLEEPDFTTAKPVNGTDKEKSAVRRVNQAVEAMYRAKGIDPSFGASLPVLAVECGLTDLNVEIDLPLVSGGMGVAEVMAQSAEQLSERYTATQVASQEDVNTYVEMCRRPDRWACYYSTVGVTARKQAV